MQNVHETYESQFVSVLDSQRKSKGTGALTHTMMLNAALELRILMAETFYTMTVK